MAATDAKARRRQSEHEARQRLAAKRVRRTYRGPRGNQEVQAEDRSANEVEQEQRPDRRDHPVGLDRVQLEMNRARCEQPERSAEPE